MFAKWINEGLRVQALASVIKQEKAIIREEVTVHFHRQHCHYSTNV
jgi:hypothetical protein